MQLIKVNHFFQTSAQTIDSGQKLKSVLIPKSHQNPLKFYENCLFNLPLFKQICAESDLDVSEQIRNFIFTSSTKESLKKEIEILRPLWNVIEEMNNDNLAEATKKLLMWKWKGNNLDKFEKYMKKAITLQGITGYFLDVSHDREVLQAYMTTITDFILEHLDADGLDSYVLYKSKKKPFNNSKLMKMSPEKYWSLIEGHNNLTTFAKKVLNIPSSSFFGEWEGRTPDVPSDLAEKIKLISFSFY